MSASKGEAAHKLTRRVIAAVIARDGKLLLCLRPAHKRHGGLWEFPGGKMQAGETILDAVRRELAEELGVEALSVGEVHLSVPDPGSTFVIDFVEATIQGIPSSTEHPEIAWVEAERLIDLPLAPSDRVFAEHLLSRLRTG